MIDVFTTYPECYGQLPEVEIIIPDFEWKQHLEKVKNERLKDDRTSD